MKKNKKGEIHEHLSFISYDKARKLLVLRQFHVEGFVNQFVFNKEARLAPVQTNDEGRPAVFLRAKSSRNRCEARGAELPVLAVPSYLPKRRPGPWLFHTPASYLLPFEDFQALVPGDADAMGHPNEIDSMRSLGMTLATLYQDTRRVATTKT